MSYVLIVELLVLWKASLVILVVVESRTPVVVVGPLHVGKPGPVWRPIGGELLPETALKERLPFGRLTCSTYPSGVHCLWTTLPALD